MVVIIMTNFCFCVIFLLLSCAILNEAYPELRQLNVIFRHGDRQPNDEISGDLTNEGRLRSYHLGQKLREMYGGFLGEHYKRDELSALSTEYARAMMSLQLVLAGLYPPKDRQRWHSTLNWQPIPYAYMRKEEDIFLFPKNCPIFEKELAAAEKSPGVQKLLEPYRKLMKNLTKLTGKEMKVPYDMFLLYHELFARKSMNQTLPPWADGIFPDGALLNGTYLAYDTLKYTDWMAKVNGGALIRKIVDDMQNKTGKLHLYSSHELLMVAVLQTLKIWKPHIPEYSSAVILELREDAGNYYVRVVYYKGIPAEFEYQEIPNCHTLCPLAKFIGLISDRLPDHDEIICSERDKRAS